MLIPWSAFWDRNYFVEGSAALGGWLTSNYTRGAITGLGLLNVWAALAELGDAFRSKASHRQSDLDQSDINHQSDISNLKS